MISLNAILEGQTLLNMTENRLMDIEGSDLGKLTEKG